MTWTLIAADCVEAMRDMEPSSIDAVVTDPPYGLEFMGKEWDRFRVDDPGTTRHRGEHAGTHGEIVPAEERDARRSPVGIGGGKRPSTFRCVGCGRRDQFRNPHACVSGTPWKTETLDPYAAPPTLLAFGEWCRTWALEALRVLKPGGHPLSFGGTRTYHRLVCALEDAGFEIRDCLAWLYGSGFPKSLNLTGEWQGWGTALKPAFEPIVLARKPLSGTVAENVLRQGVGALNVDGTRIEHGDDVNLGHIQRQGVDPSGDTVGWMKAGHVQQTYSPAGRWPANVLLDADAAAALDQQSGERPGATSFSRPKDYGATSYQVGDSPLVPGYADSGGPSRFFYTAKTSRAERENGAAYGEGRNHHPTVKPVDLMQWLCRLITPPQGVILDPFTGSGSTGIAALREGFSFIGIEREPDYVEIARARIIGDAPLFNAVEA